MKLMQTGLIFLFSVVLTACSALTNYVDNRDSKLEGEGIAISKTIQTKDLYGAWANATDDNDPNDVLLLFVLQTNHQGMAYGLETDRKTKVITTGIEHFIWQFDETNHELNSVIIKQINSVGDKRTEKVVNLKEKHKVDLYRLNNEKLAIKLVSKDQSLEFFRMPNETYNKLIKGRSDLPRLK
ncbi:MAG: hypothetical protein ACRCXK_13160 [Wohlfahrtiimonas sp.]